MTDSQQTAQAPTATFEAEPAAQAPVLVDVHDLRKEYEETVALDGISFQIRKGDIFAFIGPNGAGKTTTIRILATLLDPTAGDATIDGHDVLEEPELVRRVVGYMPDEFGVYEGITVWEYLDFFAGAFRIGKGRRGVLEGVLELTDLAPHRDRMVTTLSKGMRQRLCLAKTLIHDPKLLILDEPASAMDPRARIELRALLKELRSMGKTILISSHILTELSDISTSFGVIERGRILRFGDIGDVEALLERSRPVRIVFHRPCPESEEILAAQETVADFDREGREVRFHYRGEPERFHELVKLLVDARLPILAIEQGGGNLESLFLEVTRGELQ